jgi:hypothetical protein
MRKKAPMVGEEGEASQTPAEQFYTLVAEVLPQQGSSH